MSRDQRPRRAVMVDTPNEPGNAPSDVSATGGENAPTLAVASKKASLLVPSVLFLLGCAAGGAGISLLPLGHS